MKTHVGAPAQKRFVFDDFNPTSALVWSLPSTAALSLIAASMFASHLPPALSSSLPYGTAGMNALAIVVLGAPLTTLTSIIAIVYCSNHTGQDSVRSAFIGLNLFATMVIGIRFVSFLGDIP